MHDSLSKVTYVERGNPAKNAAMFSGLSVDRQGGRRRKGARWDDDNDDEAQRSGRMAGNKLWPLPL
jgi:hypothetical protein